MDVYSVGVLLSEMISGNSRLPPSEHSLPPNVLACVRRATDPNVDARHSSMDELCRDLERLDAELSGTAPSPSSLPPDELGFLRGVALLLATASAAVLYAGLVSLSPRVMNANEPLPFIAFGTRALGDGRVESAARFEALPALGAALCVALGLFAYALLRRHWRRAGLSVPEPELPVGASRTVLGVGGTLFGLFIGQELLVSAGFTGLVPYLPVLGGALELGLLWAVWSAVLEALRRARPLRSEPRLWCGLALGLLPPLAHFVRLVAE
jgi:hypothetical protein